MTALPITNISVHLDDDGDIIVELFIGDNERRLGFIFDSPYSVAPEDPQPWRRGTYWIASRTGSVSESGYLTDRFSASDAIKRATVP